MNVNIHFRAKLTKLKQLSLCLNLNDRPKDPNTLRPMKSTEIMLPCCNANKEALKDPGLAVPRFAAGPVTTAFFEYQGGKKWQDCAFKFLLCVLKEIALEATPWRLLIFQDTACCSHP